ncbi:MAG: adenylate/guanylate cyclase domain-containing protein [Ginsengibacter sp.]
MIKNIDHSNVIHYGFDSIITKWDNSGLGKPSCVKILKNEFAGPEKVSQLDNEFNLCSRLKCSHIRKAIRREKVEDNEALVLEYIEGKDLNKILKTERLSFSQKLHMAVDIASALTCLQKENIFHRRIKPSNILIEQSTNKVFLIDFALASEGSVFEEADTTLNENDIESLTYMAPEQTGRINRVLDQRADLYSMGLIFYRLFSGRLPFDSEEKMELVYANIAKTPENPSELDPSIPQIISEIILKLLAKNAEDRYQSAFGVKADLEKCLEQLNPDEKIDSPKLKGFQIAEADYSGKLNFNNVLYGRDKEIKKLNGLYEDCRTGHKKILVIAGNSGSGKSSLVDEFKNSVFDKKGIFLKGKFDQISSEAPYTTLIQTFNELVQLILAGDKAFKAKWTRKISDAIGNSGKILTQFMPGIEMLIGKQSESSELQGLEAQNRFNYEFTRFFKSIADKDSPLVLFVDDMQWADTSSLNLFNTIAESRDIGYALLVGAYRENEVTENHPLYKNLLKLKGENIEVEEIHLKDLIYEDAYSLISSTLHSKQENVSILSQIIFNKTKGNPFYVKQFLKSVYDEGLLHFDYESLKWNFNSDLILQMNVSGNVVELMTSFIKKLPTDKLDLLKIASTIGTQFNKRSLSLIKETSERTIENLLHQPVTEGFIIVSEEGYKFGHDRIQQAIYSLIPDDDKAAMHLRNGQKLTVSYSEKELDEKLFDIVKQWNLGAEKIVSKKEKENLARLNLKAGLKAMSSTAFPQALFYFEKGLQVLNEEHWNIDYDFILEFTTLAANAAYLSGEYEKVDLYVASILKHNKSLIDSVKGHEIVIKKLIAQNQHFDAVKEGLEILRKMNIRLPLKPGKFRVLIELVKVKLLLQNKTAEYYDQLPEMKDPEKNAAMRILSDISSASFFAVPDLVPLLAFKMIRLTMKYGLSKKSPFSFAAYGYIQSVFLNQIDKGIRFGEIALQLAKKIHADELIASIIATNNLFLVHRRVPITDTIPDLEKAFTSGLESGDNEYASYAAHNIVYQLYVMGYSLPELAKRATALELKIEKFQQDLTLRRLRIFHQSVLNLLEEKDHPDIFSGEIFDESEMDLKEVTKNTEIYFQNLYLQKLHLALVFNLKSNAEKYLPVVEKYQESVKGTTLYPMFYFYRSLVITDISPGAANKNSVLKQVKKDIAEIKKYEKYCPADYAHKILLLQAEYSYLTGHNERAKILYDKALKEATQTNLTSDLAYTWERAGRFFQNTKQDILANFYLQNAYRIYKRWGALAKLQHMENNYIQLKNGPGAEWENQLMEEPGISQTADIDLESVLKASVTLSGEIILPRLLRKMMQIIMENAGAQSGFLIMEKQGEKFIEAEIREGNEEIKILQSIPVSGTELLSESIVNYVYLTQETVILDDACKSELFGNDDYIKSHQCKSILCIPLLNMGKIQAVIYLANSLTTGAFTAKGVGILKLLAAQMSISIENALFYNELENKVKERTSELQIEKKKSDDLLLNILPEDVANELKQTGHTRPRNYEIATVMFTDFENFTSKSALFSPERLVHLIDTCFTKFDEIISRHKMEKIKTIGDAYLCVSGVPDPQSHNPVNAIKAAMEIINAIKILRSGPDGDNYFDIRIGIHTGPLVAGVVGDKKFAFDIWGDTVNTASRMEQNSEANKINISMATYELVKDKFQCFYRGEKAAKNKGKIAMYFVESEIAILSPEISE